MFPEATASPASAGSTNAQRNARYAYLVGRLRNRQMTMEEATELFGLMDGMLRTSEAARAAMMRAAQPSPTEPTQKPKATPPPTATGSDDFFLLGILAMGAGAGLLAAMTRRLQELPPVGSTSSADRANSSTKSR